MAKRSNATENGSSPGRAKSARVVVYCRIDPDTISGLDEIAETMKPQPSRAQLIDQACAEYVANHLKRRGRGEK
jgi:hypothetical protein